VKANGCASFSAKIPPDEAAEIRSVVAKAHYGYLDTTEGALGRSDVSLYGVNARRS